MKRQPIFLLVLILLVSLPLMLAAAENATIPEAVTAFLAGEMKEKAAAEEDPWRKFVYERGISEPSMELDKFDVEKGKPLSVQFLIASGDPKTKAIGKYDGSDPAGYLSSISEQVRTQDTTVKLSLTITQENGGYAAAYAKGADKALEKAVKNAAAKGKKAMNSKTILSVMTDYLVPSPIAATTKAPEALEPYTDAFKQFLTRNPEMEKAVDAAFYTVKGQKLDVTAGPEALRLTYSMADMADMADSAYITLYSGYCYDENAKSYTYEVVEAALEQEMASRAIAYRHGKQKGTGHEMTLNLLQPADSLTYKDYAAEGEKTLLNIVQENTGALRIAVMALPDYPAQEFPESGAVQGDNKGTQIIIKNRSKEIAVSLTFTSETTGEVAMVAFVRPGDKARVRVPKGYYTLETQVGVVWYGPVYRFGEATASKTEDHFKVLSSDYYHTFTYGE